MSRLDGSTKRKSQEGQVRGPRLLEIQELGDRRGTIIALAALEGWLPEESHLPCRRYWSSPGQVRS
jgi:hypothetical protein